MYLVPASPTQLETLHLDGNQIPDSAASFINQKDNVIIVKADLGSDIIAKVDTQLQAWGKTKCEAKNESGDLQFQFWHSGDLGQLCQ